MKDNNFKTIHLHLDHINHILSCLNYYSKDLAIDVLDMADENADCFEDNYIRAVGLERLKTITDDLISNIENQIKDKRDHNTKNRR